jgi:hypothetical protein
MDATDTPEQSKQPERKKRPRKTWGDADKIAAINALEANRGNLVLTEEQTGIPKSTLWMWANIHKAGKLVPTCGEIPPDPAEVAAANLQFKKDLASKLESLVHKLLDSAPDKIEKANLRDTMVAVGIGIEKMKLLRGEPTEITRREESVQQLSDDQLTDVLALARKVAEELAPRRVPLDSDSQDQKVNHADEGGTGFDAGTTGEPSSAGAVGPATTGEGSGAEEGTTGPGIGTDEPR